jgi:hypothetical protein
MKYCLHIHWAMGFVLRFEIREQLLLGFFIGQDNENVGSLRIKVMDNRNR